MALSPVVLDNFQGLDYRYDSVGYISALTAHNVTLENGSVRRRRAANAIAMAALTNTPSELWVNAAAGGTGIPYFLVRNGTRMDALTIGGTPLANTAVTDTFHTFADVATATTTLTYFVTDSAAPRTYNGATTTFATPAFTGVTPSNGKFIGVTPWDNRVVYGHGTYPSRVYFSDPGNPTTVDTNNYVDLTPGDGQGLTGIVAWRDLLFVFKATKFFVFYGTSTDSTGGPVFEYRTVDAGTGHRPYSFSTKWSQPLAHRTGLYFIGSDGEIYRTVGGIPEHVSDAISYIFRQGDKLPSPNIFGDGNEVLPQYLGGDTRYIYVGAGDSQPTLVYDTILGVWTSTSMGVPVAFTGAFAYNAVQSHLYFLRVAEKKVGYYGWRFDPDSSTTDFDTDAIFAAYRTGWVDLGQPAVEKELRDTVAHGFGAVNVGWARDYAAASSTALTLGTFSTSTLDKAHTRRAEQGALFSLSLSNTDGAFFDVHRVEAFMREQRGAGSRT